jgi:transcriptional regulator with XRE-family HTH domain
MPTDESSPRDETIGQRLRSRRLALAFSEEALAAALGVTCEQLRKYESGHGRIEAARLQHIADVLKVPVLFFFGGAFGAHDGRKRSSEIIDFAARRSDVAKPDPGAPRVERGKVKSW